jgi:hypothetical protein
MPQSPAIKRFALLPAVPQAASPNVRRYVLVRT